jgi:uncharacterized membrane protein YsdA (DUF1294 family)
MLDSRFIIFGAFINLIGSAAYAVDTLRGKTKPNRVTWVLWTIAPLVAFGGELGEGVGIQALTTFMAGFCPALILLASFLNKKAYWSITRFDVICGLFSVVALILWAVTRVGNWAIIFSIMADLLAATPTITKAYRVPESESSLAFLMAGITGALTLLTLHNWSFAEVAFPAYIVLICSLLYVLIKFPKLRPKGFYAIPS